MPLQSFVVTYGLLVLTVAVSLIAFSTPRMIRAGAESPWEIRTEGRWYQLLTSGFLHADFGHLFVNMLTLYFFGRPLEVYLGPERFLVLYFGSLVAGSLLTYARHRNDRNYRALGASGAISGVLFSFVLFQPLAGIYLFFIPIPIPAIVFAGLYVLVSLYGIRTRFGRVGHEAHLGGALGGVLLTIVLAPQVVRIFLSHFQ